MIDLNLNDVLVTLSYDPRFVEVKLGPLLFQPMLPLDDLFADRASIGTA
jgi:hypothetical protein